MRVSKSSFAAGAVAALVLGTSGAYAATGGNFILGKANAAGATTTLTNSNGTALALNAKSGTPALKVNTGVKVTNLNADKIDGLDGAALARAAGKTGTVWSDGGLWLDLDGDTWADALVAFAECPTGTVMTGGGGDDATAGGTLWMTEAIDTGVWAVASSTMPAPETIPDGTPSEELWAMAQCYNPKGSVPGASFRPNGAPSGPADTSIAEALGKYQH